MDSFDQVFGVPIEAWTFVPHPMLIEQLQESPHELTRYIFAIDTLRSRIYFKIREFLGGQAKNVNSYFSGGWADFICDGYFTRESLDFFLDSLKRALEEAGAAPLARGNVANLISVFRVEDPIVLCGQTLASFGSPSYEARKDVVDNRVRFEILYRNYRSPEALQEFGGSERAIRDYLKRLKEEKVILCYDFVFDYSKFFDTEYVPLCQATKVMDNVLRIAQSKGDLLGPIVDLLKVRPEHVSDPAENEVTHIFVNEYVLPGDRLKWKTLLYEAGGEEINLYTYPLEGTLNETPVHLSDLPDVLARAKGYSRNEGIHLGSVKHPLLKMDAPDIFLPPDCLSGHGVTLGAPGVGKTNTDLILASGAARFVQTVVIVDSTKGVASKLVAQDGQITLPIEKFILEDSSRDKIRAVLDKSMNKQGFFLLEPTPETLPSTLDEVIQWIESSPDRTTGNRAREVGGFLLLEEANDAWGVTDAERRARIRALDGMLNKAWRKGWCVWISTQYPAHLGYDEESAERVLKSLRNRVIHDIRKDRSVIEALTRVFKIEGMSKADLAFVEKSILEMEPWLALVRGMSREGAKPIDLRPVLAKVRAFGEQRPVK